MTRLIVHRTYSLGAYAAFLAASAWAALFLADVGPLPTVDSPRPGGPVAAGTVGAALVDVGLLLVFAVPHSVLARSGVKERLARVVPPALERSNYVWVASLALGLVFWGWRPLPVEVWRVPDGPVATLVWAAYAVGWVVVVASTHMTDHWEFLGLRQAGWLSPQSWSSGTLSRRWLYAWVRHPMMLGLLVVAWATPSMSVGHLVYAVVSSAYIGVGVHFEERDLRRRLGDAYVEYAREVPRFVPLGQRSLSEPDRSGSQGRSA